MTSPLYCLDTSAVIDWLERYYPPDVFPALVQHVDGMIADRRFLMSEEVWLELEDKDALAKSWGGSRKDHFVIATDAEVAHAVRGILSQYERLVGALKNRNRADPFVVAVAQLRRAVVVTGEDGGSPARPKIPYVCGELGIGCISFLELIRSEGWRF